jgi:hypothetical protein
LSAVPPGQQAEPDYSAAQENLYWLMRNGALAGVAEIIRQRRSQIERGHTVAHDCEAHADGSLADAMTGSAAMLGENRLEGLADPATDQAMLAVTGALAAAEIDRLAAEFEPERATYRCWRVPGGPDRPGYTHHVHGSGEPCPLRLP